MDNSFYQYIFNKHQQTENVPPNSDIAHWAIKLISLLFPQYTNFSFAQEADVRVSFDELETELLSLLNATQACKECNNEEIAQTFINSIPKLYQTLQTDVSAMLAGDPAAYNEFEVIRTYPGFIAISFYRIANLLLKLKTPLIPRILTEYAHSKTGIDIHPGAEIGDYLYIDHGTGIVIGETAIIGNHVKLYQGITLGALSVEKHMAGIKRHPTVEDNVVIYSGATILGGETVIGKNSIIGGNVWLTKSVPENSIVYHLSSVQVAEKSKSKF
jgi:serine O-acetyltransferase